MSKKAFLPYAIAMVTPFTQEGRFNIASVPSVVDYYKKLAPALLVCGSTGEQHCLTILERKQLYHTVREVAGPNYPLYAGVAAFKTADAIELAESALKDNYNGIMLGFPPYRKINQREAESYVRDVAAATPLPIFLYNNPPRTGFALAPDTFVKLAKTVPTVQGIKEAGDVENVNMVKPQLPDNISYLTGSDLDIVDAFTERGYTSITAIIAAVYPKEMKMAYDLIVSGKIDDAKSIVEERVRPGFELLQKTGFLPSIKYVLRKRGVNAGWCPPPMMDPTKEDMKNLDDKFELH
jgi:4-hydroxy-tetrahydrodipicolinate synthase